MSGANPGSVRACPVALAALAALSFSPGLAVRPEASPYLAPSRSPRVEPLPLPRPDVPWVAILVDDAGDSTGELDPFLSIELPLSFAILPTAARPEEVDAHLAALGREVLVHLPMEPVDPAFVPVEGWLTTNMDEATLRKAFDADLVRVPHAMGANNHMGSRFTADESKMTVVLTRIRERGMYFLDSRTTAETTCRAAAERLGLRFLERDVFLDNDAAPEAIAARFEDLVRIAREKGCALAIGHARPATAEAIRRFAAGRPTDVEVVPASRLVGRVCHPAGRP